MYDALMPIRHVLCAAGVLTAIVNVRAQQPPSAPRGPAFEVASVKPNRSGELGLKLESTRAPLEVLVIDRVERPTPD